MDIERIRKNAPEGASHINQNGDYFKVIDCTLMIWCSIRARWFKSSIMKSDILKPL